MATVVLGSTTIKKKKKKNRVTANLQFKHKISRGDCCMDVLIVTIITVLSFFLYNHDNKMTPHGGDSSTNNPIKEQITVKYL